MSASDQLLLLIGLVGRSWFACSVRLLIHPEDLVLDR